MICGILVVAVGGDEDTNCCPNVKARLDSLNDNLVVVTIVFVTITATARWRTENVAVTVPIGMLARHRDKRAACDTQDLRTVATTTSRLGWWWRWASRRTSRDVVAEVILVERKIWLVANNLENKALGYVSMQRREGMRNTYIDLNTIK